MREGTVNSYIKGPRWAGFPVFLKKLAIHLGLEIELDIHKGWISETVFYELTGPEHELYQFKDMLDKALTEYNG